jgi:hypothetical protein
MTMIRFYIKLIPLSAMIFLGLSVIARALGTTQPPNPALRGFVEGCENKPQPCWYGIVPGVTRRQDVITQLAKNMGYDIDPAYLMLTQLSIWSYEPPICDFALDNDGYVISKITLHLCSAKASYTKTIIVESGYPKNRDFAVGGFLNDLK